MAKKVLFFDIETHSADELWNMSPEQFFRLGGYAWGTGGVRLTDDIEEMREEIRQADLVIGHNIHAFDLTALFGKNSLEPFHMALDGKVYDTWADAPIIEPYPDMFTDRHGRKRLISGPRQAMSYYGLDEMANRWGTSTKTQDLKALAKQFGGFDLIPLDNDDFRTYLIGDVKASRELATAMRTRVPWDEYRAREQRLYGILAQCSRNGIVIDVDKAYARLEILNDRKNKHLALLHEKFGLPTEGKAPLRTKPGKEAVFAALESVGIQREDLPKTKTGNPSLGGKEILATAEGRGDEAESLAQSLAAISGARMTPETLLNNMHKDGKVHPGITALQQTARFSFHDPGLTVIGARGDGANDKAILSAPEGFSLVEFDFQAADSRAVAGYSGDERFYDDYIAKDAHNATASLLWPSAEFVKGKHPRRQEAKVVTHGTAYRMGAKKLAQSAGITQQEAYTFLKKLSATYPRRAKWQEDVTEFAQTKGYVVNDWGRKLAVNPDRAFTQGCATLGQNATREMLVDLLLRLDRGVSRWLVGIIHDAVLFSFPEDKAVEYSKLVEEAAHDFNPRSGLRVPFPLEAGKPGRNWLEASH